MGIIDFFKKKFSKQKREQVDAICKEVDDFISSIGSFLDSKQDEFISLDWASEIETSSLDIFQKISEMSKSSLRPDKSLSSSKKKLQSIIGSLEMTVHSHNSEVACRQRENARTLIGNVEGYPLDDQQMDCIVKSAHNHLVIAGAGTGKTTTIVGKIKYLLATGTCKPEDILVLSFTNASASEMKQRIENETGCSIHASTFHSLGLEILTYVQGIKPKITKTNLTKFVKDTLTELIKKPSYLNMLCNYMLYNHKYNKDEFSFKNREEYEEYLRMNKPVTLKNEEVKSYGEMKIANILFQNGISYQYEKEYQTDTRTAEYFQYYPDFYLPDYHIYIEYFGIDREGNAPAFFSPTGNVKDATARYREGMEWKRNLHKEQATSLIEIYAYENMEGIIEQSLVEKLKAVGVELHPIAPEEVWSKINESFNDALTAVTELFSTVISLIKDNDISFLDFSSKYLSLPTKLRNNMLISLLEPIYIAYTDSLKKNGEIDFSDMINMAVKAVTRGAYVNHFSYVIVDEYQDISKSRFRLLESLRKSSNYDLFCVGDDWQSIYRFAGSDVNYIIRFSDFWGSSETSKIETTYRYSDTLAEVSGYFVMQNPSQIKKTLKGRPDEVGFPIGDVMGYAESTGVEHILERLEDLPRNSSVYFIGRYNFDSRIIDSCKELNCNYNNVSGLIDVIYPRRPDLKMNFITAHRSKGLQADYVFIINNKKDRMGFPSTIQDDSAVDILLEGTDDYPFAEERRLFYVALTRAKKKVFLLVLKDRESIFSEEIHYRYGEAIKRDAFTCPQCGAILVKHRGQYGDFYGCSNYSKTGCTYKRKINAKSVQQDGQDSNLENDNICPWCKGFLKIRTVKNGTNAGSQFLGCSNFPKCRYTRSI